VILRKLYTTPDQLFEPVRFVDGINIIFGKKDDPKAPKKSINGIGKSTFLDMLDFALLASYQKNHSPRLYAAYQKGLLKGQSVVLEFEVNGIEYAIERSFDDPTLIRFSEQNSSFETISFDNFKRKLCDLVFYKPAYSGFYSNNWLRKLLPFFIKVQKPKKEKFTDPIQYIKETPIVELLQYHLFLMDIDNVLAHDNLTIQTQKKKTVDTINNVGEFINESYGLKDIPEAISKTQNLKIEIEELKESISKFNLSKQYEIDESKANELTTDIKELWFHNHSDRKKIEMYQESVKNNIEISTRKIKKLYEDLNFLLAGNIKKSLDEAVEFKKRLVASREEFIESEVQQLLTQIKKREALIKQREEERKKIFDFLASEKAIGDLTEAFMLQSDKSKELSDIESQVKLYQDLNVEKNKLEQEEKRLEGEILEFVQQTNNSGLSIARLFRNIYNGLYPELNDPSIFTISDNVKLDAKIQINILPSTQMLSKGRNQGRTLIYDLTILFNSIEKEVNAPRFLIHDGIFDGMDKAQFIALYEYLEEQKLQGKKFQYIMTYNEEGTLTNKFGHADKVSTEKLEQEAILVLTPRKKLLGDF
jgi:uncharacterized protein YydD (DUF2326 family)